MHHELHLSCAFCLAQVEDSGPWTRDLLFMTAMAQKPSYPTLYRMCELGIVMRPWSVAGCKDTFCSVPIFQPVPSI